MDRRGISLHNSRADLKNEQANYQNVYSSSSKLDPMINAPYLSQSAGKRVPRCDISIQKDS